MNCARVTSAFDVFKSKYIEFKNSLYVLKGDFKHRKNCQIMLKYSIKNLLERIEQMNIIQECLSNLKSKKVDPNLIELPCGSFYFADDDPIEIGYEAEIDWYEKTSDLYYQPVGVFIEVDTLGTKDRLFIS